MSGPVSNIAAPLTVSKYMIRSFRPCPEGAQVCTASKSSPSTASLSPDPSHRLLSLPCWWYILAPTHFQLYSDSPFAASPPFLQGSRLFISCLMPSLFPSVGLFLRGNNFYVSTVKRQGWGSIAPSLTNFYNGFSPNPACIILPGFRPSALEIVSGSGSSPTVRIG